MTIQEIRDLLAQTAEITKENSEQMKERDKQMKERDKRLDERFKKLSRYMSSVTNNQADMVEEFVYNTIDYHNKKLFGIQFDDIENNIKGKIGKTKREYDIVLYNGDSIGIVEVKSKAHINDLDTFGDKINDFRVLFKDYQDFKIYIGIASLHINDDIIIKCKAKGYGVIKLAGEKMEIISNEVKAY